ncbi:MAG: hypothetical protein WCF36_01450, partial [Candidatus Nanopelagicales bacterium]
MVEVREVLRGWLEGQGLRVVARRAGVDRKTARRYVEAAQAAGLTRDSGVDAVDDELVGVVVDAVRPARPNGHGQAWEALEARHDQIQAWVTGSEQNQPLSVVKVETLLARSGCVVPYRTLHRYAVERCGFRVKGTTVRVVDGEPGVECQIDFAQMGFLLDPDTGRRKVHALIFTAVVSRHMFVWLSYSQTLAAVIAGCEAAWTFFQGVFKVLIPDNLKPVVTDRTRSTRCCRPGGWTTPSTPGSSPTPPGSPPRRTSRGWNGSCSTCAATSGPGRRSSTWP